MAAGLNSPFVAILRSLLAVVGLFLGQHLFELVKSLQSLLGVIGQDLDLHVQFHLSPVEPNLGDLLLQVLRDSLCIS